MAAILTSLRNTIIAGIVLTVIMVLYVTNSTGEALTFAVPTFDHEYFTFFMRWLHVLCGVMWIGLLWYLNFIQIPNMPNIPDEQKPAIGKVIAPAVLFWFRWGAMGTLVTGLLLAWMSGYLMQAISLGLGEDGTEKFTAIGIGMWLGAIMWFNVWFVIGRISSAPWAWSRRMPRPRPRRPGPRCCSRGPTRSCRYRCFTRWCRLRTSTKISHRRSIRRR